METIDVGLDFTRNLTNKTGGKYAADEFRDTYLFFLDNKAAWQNVRPEIILDFSNVRRISPSFAYEAFGYFRKYGSMADILGKIKFQNISEVKRLIIEQELSENIICDDERHNTIVYLEERTMLDIKELQRLKDTCPHNETENGINNGIVYITCHVCQQQLPLDPIDIYRNTKDRC